MKQDRKHLTGALLMSCVLVGAILCVAARYEDFFAGKATAEALNYTPKSLTVTNGDVIVSGDLRGYLRLTPSSIPVATCTVANARNSGRVLILENAGTNSVLFEDNGTRLALGSNITLGPTDTLTLIANKTNWVRVANANN